MEAFHLPLNNDDVMPMDIGDEQDSSMPMDTDLLPMTAGFNLRLDEELKMQLREGSVETNGFSTVLPAAAVVSSSGATLGSSGSSGSSSNQANLALAPGSLSTPPHDTTALLRDLTVESNDEELLESSLMTHTALDASHAVLDAAALGMPKYPVHPSNTSAPATQKAKVVGGKPKGTDCEGPVQPPGDGCIMAERTRPTSHPPRIDVDEILQRMREKETDTDARARALEASLSTASELVERPDSGTRRRRKSSQLSTRSAKIDLSVTAGHMTASLPALEHVADRDVVILLGNTGAGKTLLVHALAGRTVQKVDYTPSGSSVSREVWDVDNPVDVFAVGHGKASKTKCIRQYVRSPDSVVYLDAPGCGAPPCML